MIPLPEPVMRTQPPYYDGRDQFYTADQMRAYGDARAAEALERAARVGDDLRTDYTDGPWEAGYLRAVVDLAAAIRALKETK